MIAPCTVSLSELHDPSNHDRLFQSIVGHGHAIIRLDRNEDAKTIRILENARILSMQDSASSLGHASSMPGKLHIVLKDFENGGENEHETINYQKGHTDAYTCMYDISLLALTAITGAPSCVGDLSGFKQLLGLERTDTHPLIASELHINRYTSDSFPSSEGCSNDLGSRSDSAAEIDCHKFHVDRGLLTLIYAHESGLEIKISNGSLVVTPEHQDPTHLIVFPGQTLQRALLSYEAGGFTVMATSHRAIPMPGRVSLAFKLRASEKAVMNQEVLQRKAIKPMMVADVYTTLRSIHEPQQPQRTAAAAVKAQVKVERERELQASKRSCHQRSRRLPR